MKKQFIFILCFYLFGYNYSSEMIFDSIAKIEKNIIVTPLPQSEPVSYQVKFLSSVNMDVIVKEDTERFIAQSRKLFFAGIKAAFLQSYNGANGDETVVNRSYSF